MACSRLPLREQETVVVCIERINADNNTMCIEPFRSFTLLSSVEQVCHNRFLTSMIHGFHDMLLSVITNMLRLHRISFQDLCFVSPYKGIEC